MQEIKGVIVGAIIIAAVAVVIAVIGQAVITYWPIVLVILAALVGGVVYLKHRKRTQNLV